jgi:hypothetical protein
MKYQSRNICPSSISKSNALKTAFATPGSVYMTSKLKDGKSPVLYSFTMREMQKRL